MVAALEIDFGLLAHAVIQDDIEAVALADRRDRTVGAVGEQLVELVLGGERTIFAEPRSQIPHTLAMARRHDGKYVAVAGSKHHALGQTIGWNPASAGRRRRRQRRRVRNEVVIDMLAGKVFLQGLGNRHSKTLHCAARA